MYATCYLKVQNVVLDPDDKWAFEFALHLVDI